MFRIEMDGVVVFRSNSMNDIYRNFADLRENNEEKRVEIWYDMGSFGDCRLQMRWERI